MKYEEKVLSANNLLQGKFHVLFLSLSNFLKTEKATPIVDKAMVPFNAFKKAIPLLTKVGQWVEMNNFDSKSNLPIEMTLFHSTKNIKTEIRVC